MAHNKFEDQIREKLNSREIQPSAQAWDRLDAMLTVAEEKKTKRSPFLSFRFVGIAAAIAILLIAGMFFFSQKNAEINTENNVVGTEIEKDTIQNKDDSFQTPIVEKKQVAESTGTQSSNAQNQNSNKEEVSIINQKTINQKQSNNPLINREKQIEYLLNSDVAIKDIPKMSTGSQIISGGNKEIKSDDFLLAGLDKTASQSTNNKTSVKVDAKSLLSQVDGELELTFREKVINRVSKNYKEVKVALANRNQE